MQKWAFSIILNASKKNARRRERLFKYFSDVQVENGIVRFAHTSTSSPTRVFDLEAQAFTYTETHTGRIVYEDLNVEEQVTLYDPSKDDDYEPIDWHT
jgi:hypothetical protein